MLVAEPADWSIAHDMRELACIARSLGIEVADRRLLNATSDQCVFYGSQFDLLNAHGKVPPHRTATAYFHGRPGTPGEPTFDSAYDALRRLHPRLARIQVSHAEMRDVVLSSGIDPAKVHRIRIGIDLACFAPRAAGEREAARAAFGIPGSAFVIGSFQKDGIGWTDGLQPKLVKGPDVLVEALDRLRQRRPELFVVLSGPARGYVRAELERLGIPYVHRYVRRYEELRSLYLPLDAVAVPSRQEGGPKAVLEGMAVGIPVVSTRVGQAQELIDGGNGALVNVEDADGLAEGLAAAADVPETQIERARVTAEQNAYTAQAPLWQAFFDGFVDTARR
jgi:glycosyltransferase involved in cell wall biosynthesis